MFSYRLQDFTFNNEDRFFIQYGWHNEDFVKHTHEDFTELTIVLSGEAVHVVNEEQFHIGKGDVFVIPDKIQHGFIQVKDFRVCNIMYDPEIITFNNKDIRETAGYQALFCIEPYYAKNRHFGQYLHLQEREFVEVEYLLQQIMKEYHENKEGRRTMVELLFQQLVVEMSRCYDHKIEKEKTHNSHIKLAQSISYMEQHYLEDISIEKIAQDANYSKRHFIRLFKEIYHTTPLDYVISMRLSCACRHLQNSSRSIGDIARDSGFSNSNYFYRLFKKRMGMSPKEYRSKNNELHRPS